MNHEDVGVPEEQDESDDEEDNEGRDFDSRSSTRCSFHSFW